MPKKIKIAFDLDGVIIDKPPIIPKNVIETLFRGSKKRILDYKIPKSKLAVSIRKLSHLYFFRPALKDNIEFIKKLKETGKYEIYIVTGRYSFLKSETLAWLKNRKINKLFKQILLNENDEQPHIFKEKALRIIKPEIFVDDDKAVIDYLSGKNNSVKFFHLPYQTLLSEIKILD